MRGNSMNALNFWPYVSLIMVGLTIYAIFKWQVAEVSAGEDNRKLIERFSSETAQSKRDFDEKAQAINQWLSAVQQFDSRIRALEQRPSTVDVNLHQTKPLQWVDVTPPPIVRAPAKSVTPTLHRKKARAL